MMGTEIFKIDAPWAEKLRKMRVSFLMNPSVSALSLISCHQVESDLMFVAHVENR